MRRRKIGRRYLAGMLGSVMLLTSVLGNAALASEDAGIPEDIVALEEMTDETAADIVQTDDMASGAQARDLDSALPADEQPDEESEGAIEAKEDAAQKASAGADQTEDTAAQKASSADESEEEDAAHASKAEEQTKDESVTEAQTGEATTTKPADTDEADPAETEETEETEASEKDAEAQEETRSIETVVDGTTITMSGPQSSFPEGTSYEIRASRLSASEEEAVQAALEKKAVESQTNISSYQAFDITLIVDGAEAQPTGAVSVTFTGAKVADTVAGSDEVQVFHVDEKTGEVNDIQSEKVSDTEVVMETTHFSTYVIVNGASQEITVTVNHYLASERETEQSKKSKLFRTKEHQVPENKQLRDFTSDTAYYTVNCITQTTGEEEVDITSNLLGENLPVYTASENVTINVYYVKGKGSYRSGATFFDYNTGGKKDEKSINYEGNYSKGSSENNRLGTYHSAGYNLSVGQTVVINGDAKTARFNANSWRRLSFIWSGTLIQEEYTTDAESSNHDNPPKSWPIITGLVSGLSGSDYEQVNFNYDEPGFFSQEEKAGKTIYDGLELSFTRNGNEYTLTNVYDGENSVCSDMSNFFPLDCKNGGNRNEYFGMRYDFTFKTGDYLGDMEYSFTGDDDLWVFLDGKLILDMGGIHAAYPGPEYAESQYWPNTVDIWEKLIGTTDYSEEDKLAKVDNTAEHTVTVLFMERGGNKSNCHMTFVMPDVQAKTPVISNIPKANLTFTKTNTDGEALGGAEFQLKEDTSGSTYKAISESNGTVTFTNLKEGNYTLTETKAPTGYVASHKTWKVEVESNGSSAEATLYDGEKAITSISNTSIDKVVENGKTAVVEDEANRIFQINLNASSLSTTVIGGNAKPVDIVLVLDQSGSMGFYSGSLSGETVKKQDATYNEYYYFEKYGELYRCKKNWWGWFVEKQSDYNWSSANVRVPDTLHTDYITRMEALHTASKEFVNLLAEQSSDSRIAIATYESKGYAKLALTSVESEKDTIIKTLNGIKDIYGGGTEAYHGLNQAAKYLAESTDGREKIVVLLSDGDDQEKKLAKSSAKTLKDAGVTIYSVGFKVTTTTKSFLEEIATNPSHYFGADNMEELVAKFKLIADSTTVGQSITNATIVDYIDPRFDVTDQSGNILDEGDEVSGGKLYKDDNGNWYIQWDNQSIAPKGADGSVGWTASFHVKAKEDFMGGNAIPTNGDAYISFDGNTKPFPKPTVNVALLDLSAGDKETTVFVKDEITPAELVKELKGTFKIENKIENPETGKQFAIPEASMLTEDELNDLIHGTATQITKPYSYGTSDQVGTFTYTYQTIGGKPDTHPADRIGEGVEQYQLTVTYTALPQKDRLTSSELTPAGTEVTESKQKEAVYKVNVVAGSVDITKTIKGTWNAATEGDPIFTFKITRHYEKATETVTETFYRTISFKGKDDNTNTLSAELLKELPRGTYTVTELDTQRYDTVTVANNDSKSVYDTEKVDGTVHDDKAISFNIGVEENANDFDELNGYALFTNTKTTGGKRTDTDVIMNRYSYNEKEGAWEVTQERVPQEPSTSEKTVSNTAYLVPEKKQGIGCLDGDGQNPEVRL